MRSAFDLAGRRIRITGAAGDIGEVTASRPIRRTFPSVSAAEIAWPIASLCSQAASQIAGTVLDLIGGSNMN